MIIAERDMATYIGQDSLWSRFEAISGGPTGYLAPHWRNFRYAAPEHIFEEKANKANERGNAAHDKSRPGSLRYLQLAIRSAVKFPVAQRPASQAMILGDFS